MVQTGWNRIMGSTSQFIQFQMASGKISLLTQDDSFLDDQRLGKSSFDYSCLVFYGPGSSCDPSFMGRTFINKLA